MNESFPALRVFDYAMAVMEPFARKVLRIRGRDIDRAERAGLLERRPCPGQYGRFLTLTDEGRKALRRLRARR